jgi:hypothetical protein
MAEIKAGDRVQVRFIEPTRIVRNTNQIYTVVTVPGNGNLDVRFWELSLAGDLFVVDAPMIIKLVDGAP